MNSSLTLRPVLFHLRIRRGMTFGIIIIVALLAFEVFNYSTTEFALTDLLGELHFGGVRWATILAIAFCGIDFAGLARLFTPESGVQREGMESWYLFGAWLIAATMNAVLTWWGVAIALLSHETLGNELVSQNTLIKVAPIFVALMVWVIRVLIIGTFSVAGNRLFSQDEPKAVLRPIQKRTPMVAAPNPGVESVNQSVTAARRSVAAKDGYRSDTRPNPIPPPSAIHITQPMLNIPARQIRPEPVYQEMDSSL